MNMRKTFNIVCVLSALAPNFLMAAGLSEPDKIHAVPTVLRSLSGLHVADTELYLFGPRLDEYVRTPFNSDGKSRAERFGEYVNAERLKFPKTALPAEWRGILHEEGKRRILWDATSLRLIQFFPENGSVVQESTVAADLLKPPADRMGEPTVKETTSARQRFKAAYRKVFGLRYSGLVRAPKGWMAGAKNYFVVATKIADFPVTVLACLKDDPMSCMMDRFCYLEGGPKIAAKAVSGVAAQAQSNLLYLGDSERQAIHVYKWDSCLNVRFQKSIALPKSLQKITTLQIDSEGRLWVGTDKWDNNFDSSLYYWDTVP